MLAFRITRSALDLKPFFEKLSQYSDKIVVYQHDEASRVHVHGLVEGCKPSSDTLKNWIKNVVGKVERTDWSFITKDVDIGFITYMSKGKLDPVFVHNYETDLIHQYKGKWEDRPKIYKQQRLQFVVKESPAERKMRQEDMVQEIIRRLPDRPTTKELLEMIVQVVIKENKNVVGRYKLRDYYDTISSRVNPESFIDSMHRMVQKDFY